MVVFGAYLLNLQKKTYCYWLCVTTMGSRIHESVLTHTHGAVTLWLAARRIRITMQCNRVYSYV